MEVGALAPEKVGLPKREGFFPVRIASLSVDTVTDFDLYLWSSADRPMVLYREKNLVFTEEIKQRLLEGSTSHVYVSGEQSGDYHRYVETNLGSILKDSEIPLVERSEILYESSVGIVKELFADPRAEGIIKRSQALVENAVQFMFSHSHAFASLLKVSSFDYYTYTHSVNVFVFSVALARYLGYPETTVLQIGNGALLHDVGKAEVDSAIINCRGKLSPEQWTIMKCHPVFGQRILIEQGIRDAITLDVARHHHEKLDGTGYPDGLRDGEIGKAPRVCTIADIFDALTTKRSYKEALKSFAALRLMKDEMVAGLDTDFFKHFIELMGDTVDKHSL